MPVVTIIGELERARREGYALPLFDTVDMQSTEGMFRAFLEKRAPGIVALYSGLLQRPSTEALVAYIRTRAEGADVPVSLMLDHGASLDLCKRAVDLGFTDVMFDGSQLPLADNIAITREVVRYAHSAGVGVEAELGHVGRGSDYEDQGAVRRNLTDPDTVERFVVESGVDLLAIAVGTAHGLYAGVPELHLDLLQEIRERVGIPLVLHGGTGLSAEQFRAAIQCGISKINVATDLFVTAAKRIAESARGDNVSYFALGKTAEDSFLERCGYYLDLFGASGKAG